MVNGLDTAFSNRVRRTKGESGGSSYSTLLTYSKFYATQLEATLLQIRPMGTYRGSLASYPTWGVLQFSLIPLRSDFVEVYKGTGNMDLVTNGQDPRSIYRRRSRVFGLRVH